MRIKGDLNWAITRKDDNDNNLIECDHDQFVLPSTKQARGLPAPLV